MENKNIVVMLDAGHGGTDSGAVGNGVYEKDLVLKLVQYESEIWKSIGVTPILTRNADEYVSLVDRTRLENSKKPSCFISHHLDSASATASGATVWLHSKAPNSYVEWGKDVIYELHKVGITSNRSLEVNRGYRGDTNVDYAVNRDTIGPSMLIEFGFITNTNNLNEFNSKYKQYAIGVVKATCKFLGIDFVYKDEELDSLKEDVAYLKEEIKKLTEKNNILEAKIKKASEILTV